MILLAATVVFVECQNANYTEEKRTRKYASMLSNSGSDPDDPDDPDELDMWMAVGIAAFLSDLEARPESVEGHESYRPVRFNKKLTLDSMMAMLTSTFGTGVVWDDGKPVTGCIRLNREIFKCANAIA